MWVSVKGEENPKNGRCYLGWRPACGLSLLWEWQEGVMVFTIEVNCRITEIKKRNGERGCLPRSGGCVRVIQEAGVGSGDSSL